MFWRWWRTRYVELTPYTSVKEQYRPFRGWVR